MMEGAIEGKTQQRGLKSDCDRVIVPGVKQPAVTDPRTQSKHGAASGTAGSAWGRRSSRYIDP